MASTQDAEPTPAINKRIRREVEDALLLLEYAIAIGFRTEDGRTIPDTVLETIKTTAAKLADENARRFPPRSG
jgi:hypothetical protein